MNVLNEVVSLTECWLTSSEKTEMSRVEISDMIL